MSVEPSALDKVTEQMSDLKISEAELEMRMRALLGFHGLVNSFTEKRIDDYFEQILKGRENIRRSLVEADYQHSRLVAYSVDGRVPKVFAKAIRGLYGQLSPSDFKENADKLIKQRIEFLQQKKEALEKKAYYDDDFVPPSPKEEFQKWLFDYFQISDLSTSNQERLIADLGTRFDIQKIEDCFCRKLANLEGALYRNRKCDTFVEVDKRLENFYAQYEIDVEKDPKIQKELILRIILLTEVVQMGEDMVSESQLSHKSTKRQTYSKSGKRVDRMPQQKKSGNSTNSESKPSRKERRKVDEMRKSCEALKQEVPVVQEVLTLLQEKEERDLYPPCQRKGQYMIPKSYMESSHYAQQAFLWINSRA